MSFNENLVFFGKGGIGKSTIASNISALLGASGRKVLHVGCDPKMDSTLSLAGRHIQPFGGASGPDAEARLRGFIQPAQVKGVYCVEAGGPLAGLGCAGAGISSLLETIKGARIMEEDGYGAAVFDVLGDVVCGGFAAPLRRGFAKKVVIVTSEEPLSLYSANRLIMMTENFSRNGVFLAGLVINCRDASRARLAEAFAASVNARVLGVIPRDPAVEKAELRRVPAALAFPKSPFAAAAARLCSAVLAAGPQKTAPRALSDAQFGAFIAGTAGGPPAEKTRASSPRSTPAEAFRKAGLSPVGLEGGQIICDWQVPGGTRRVVISPAGPGTSGRLHRSDWAACIHPTSDESAAGGETIADAVSALESFPFSRLMDYFGAAGDFHGAAGALASRQNFSDGGRVKKSAPPRRPHMGAGQWHRFLFPEGVTRLALPPGLAVAEHGDSECRFCEAPGGPLGLFGSGGDSLPVLPKDGTGVFSTGFGLREALTGEGALVKKALEAAARSAGPGGVVEFYSTCGPMLLAGDTASAAAAAEKKYGVKVLREDYNSYGEFSPGKAAARAELIYAGLSRAQRKARKPRYDLSLFEYPYLNESMQKTLAGTGLSLSGETGFYERLVSARLQVLPAYDAALCPALDKAGLRWLAPPAPFGFKGTRDWFFSIFSALGRGLPASAKPTREQAAARKELAGRARRFSAGFVTAAEELPSLSSGLLDLPRLAAEAGFGIRLLLRLDKHADRSGAVRAATREAARAGAAGFETAFFSDPAGLGRLLRVPASMRLVYSDINMDPRILAAGKAAFSSRVFEPGYDGALESARRLLAFCGWEFISKYAADLQ